MRRELKDLSMSSNALRQETSNDEMLNLGKLFERYRGLVPKRTIDYWRYTKKGPPFIKIGRRVLYPLAGVIARERKRSDAREGPVGACGPTWASLSHVSCC